MGGGLQAAADVKMHCVGKGKEGGGGKGEAIAMSCCCREGARGRARGTTKTDKLRLHPLTGRHP
jgi:hypothetical protein